MKIENWKLKIILLASACLLSAGYVDAGLIVQRPLYIGLDSGLVGYWSFDGPDMSGNTAYDRSGQGNNGTLNIVDKSFDREPAFAILKTLTPPAPSSGRAGFLLPSPPLI